MVSLSSLSGCGTLGDSGVAVEWWAGRGRQNERVSAAGWTGRARTGGGRLAACWATLPSVLSSADVIGPALAFASSRLGGTSPSPPAGDPVSAPPPASIRPRATPQIQEWFGPQLHQCLFCESGSHIVCETLPPPFPTRVKWPGAKPRLQLSSPMAIQLPSYICISWSCHPMVKQHPPPLPRGRYSRWIAPLLGSKDGGKVLPQRPQ